jgi:hypothetical protein
VGVGLDRAEIVDRDDFNVVSATLDDGTQHVSANAAETIDRDLDWHMVYPPGWLERR